MHATSRGNGALLARPERTSDGLVLEGWASCAAAAAAAVTVGMPLLHELHINGLDQGSPQAATFTCDSLQTLQPCRQQPLGHSGEGITLLTARQARSAL